MKILEDLIRHISPNYALKRLQSNAVIKNYYDATQNTHLRKKRISGETTANNQVNTSLVEMRELARELDRNHDMAKGILNTLVAKIVGSGIIPQPEIKTKDGKAFKELNRLISKEFKRWSKTPDVTKSMSFGKASRLACRSWLRDGECLTKHHSGNVRGLVHNTNIKYSIELLEGDYLPVMYEDIKKNIYAGIRFDKWGAPKTYYLDRIKKDTNNITSHINYYSPKDLTPISADKVSHLALRDRLHQARGMSCFASVFTRLDDIKDYEESERVAARVAAAMTSFIKKPVNGISADVKRKTDDTRYYEMQPGIIYDDLAPGEEPVSMQSNRPSGLLGDFRDAMLKMVSSGTGAGYSSISKNYDGSYVSRRQEQVEQSAVYAMLIEEFNSGWTRPVWDKFMQALLLTDIDLSNADMNTLYDVHFQNPITPWLDPKKNAEENEILNRLKVKSRSKIVREQGENPDDVFDIIQQENEVLGDAGQNMVQYTEQSEEPS